MFKPITLNVVVQNSNYVKHLEWERDEANKRAKEWNERYDRIAIKCADEQRVNLELLDLLRAHGIKYRPTADMRTW